MLFNSPEFIFLFLPVSLFIFFQVGRRGYHQAAIIWLVAASLFFYGWWQVAYLGLLLASIAFNYLIGMTLSRLYPIELVERKYLLTFGIVVNLGLLGYFKYANFLVSSTNELLGTNFNLQTIILPLAISFFTFNQVAYLVDAYRGEAKEYDFFKYCLFITFFPHLIAGPIVHHKEMIPQFDRKHIYHINPNDIAIGLTIFSIGLCKKLFFADSIAVYATPVFDAAAHGVPLTFLEAWSGAITYSLQLYFDFSGYSDMAIGAARLFGIKFPLNFSSPYKAVNIIDFWRRWHMTLSQFLRDYLYIPLGGNRKGKLQRYVNLMITMLLGGLWHGAGWTFVIWGGLHGVYLIINHQWHSFRRALGHNLNQSYWWSRGLGCLITFLAVVVAWVFFRAKNIDTAMVMLHGMTGTSSISVSQGLLNKAEVIKSAFLSVGLLSIAWFFPNTQQWLQDYSPAIDQPKKYHSQSSARWQKHLHEKLKWQPNIGFGLLFGFLLFICTKTFLAASPSEFLYFQF